MRLESAERNAMLQVWAALARLTPEQRDRVLGLVIGQHAADRGGTAPPELDRDDLAAGLEILSGYCQELEENLAKATEVIELVFGKGPQPMPGSLLDRLRSLQQANAEAKAG